MFSDLDPVGLEEYYLDYINKKNEENREERYVDKESYYHASGAGFCSRKLYYQSIEKAKPTNTTHSIGKYRMRLGTIVHNDFQNAFSDTYIYNNKDINNNNINILDIIKEKEYSKKKKPKVKFHIEQEIVIPELNVRGFYDIVAEQHEDQVRVYLYDLKTIGAFGWSKSFGRDIKNTNENYKLQLGTYGIAVKEQFGRLDGMYLLFYNKDTSQMKTVLVSNNYLKFAKNYWQNVIKEHSKGVPDFIKGISPAEKWACGYCDFKDHCNPPDYKNKVR